MNNQNLDSVYTAEWILSILLVAAGSGTIIYTLFKVGRDIPASFKLILGLYLLIYAARLLKVLMRGETLLIGVRTAITTTTNCMIDLCILFFIFEIAIYRHYLIKPREVNSLALQRMILLMLSVVVDISKVYTDVSHLQGYKY